jgi:tetratricopeptide (TPR) repeat protein
MKRLIISVILGLPLAGSLLMGAGNDSLFLRGNALYEEGKYEEALGVYNQVLQGDKESADLYYNMGNAAYRSNSIGYAILYYEKALKLEPAHEDAANNLEFVSSYRFDTFEEVPQLFLRVWIRGFVRLLPERIWSILALLFFLSLLTGIVVYLFAHRIAAKKAGFLSAAVALLLFGLAISSAASRHREIINPASGIILAPSVVVRSSPSETGTELFILHEGTKIEVSEEVSGWQNIRVMDGREGWILSKDFDSI